MAYSELIKNFEKIRGYMREFYVYGFKSREEYDRKSSRSYDNERRRIESWLGEYMSFRQNAGGKTVFLTVDNRGVSHNPLYKAFKAKSFTDNDITLHFYLLDLLSGDEELSIREIMDRISRDYLSHFTYGEELDESTIRKKLREYEQLGLLERAKAGRELIYRRKNSGVDLESWREAIAFFAEADPLGVVGATLLDKQDGQETHFSYKHHYLLHALDSEILCELLLAIREKRGVTLTSFVRRQNEERENTVFPLRIHISTQTGRQYLLALQTQTKRPRFFRLDNIRRVKAGPVEERAEEYRELARELSGKLWGVSTASLEPEHLEMTIRVGEKEGYIRNRLEREKRCGHVEQTDPHTLTFTADVYDAMEMLPWIRSFIGRIVRLECSNKAVEQRFREDLETMQGLYGGADDAVS